jgi:hypothetical protein
MRNPLAPLRQAIPSLAHPELERALTALVDAAGNDIAKARENIEAWYDSSMDRVSGWYKRHVQFMTFVVALGLVFVCNVDTLTITRALAQDAVLRARIVADAEAYTKANLPSTPAADASSKKDEAPSGAKPLPKDADKAGAPPAAAIEGAPADAKKGSSAKNDAKSPEDKLDGVSQEIRKLGLPLGWGTDDPRTALPTGLSAFLYKIFGLLLTAIAVSLGAPFWFDMLNRIMVVRATVKPREKSPDEPAVDR